MTDSMTWTVLKAKKRKSWNLRSIQFLNETLVGEIERKMESCKEIYNWIRCDPAL